MDQPYSAVADFLNKFHTSPVIIQALWLLAVPVVVLGVTWFVMRGLRDIAVAVVHPRSETRSLLVHGVVQDPDRRWYVIRTGREPQPVDWRNPPPELVGRVNELN